MEHEKKPLQMKTGIINIAMAIFLVAFGLRYAYSSFYYAAADKSYFFLFDGFFSSDISYDTFKSVISAYGISIALVGFLQLLASALFVVICGCGLDNNRFKLQKGCLIFLMIVNTAMVAGGIANLITDKFSYIILVPIICANVAAVAMSAVCLKKARQAV